MSVAHRALAGGGALVCALSLALAAFAAHAHVLGADNSRRVGLTAAMLFAHGLALLLLAPAANRCRLWALTMLAAGALLFAGSVLGAALAGWSPLLAPAGGWLLIIGWLLVAFDAFRR